MKKIFNFFAVALVALTAVSLASCKGNGDEPSKDEFKFVAPQVEWNADVDAVNAFMSANLAEFTTIWEDSMPTDKGVVYTRRFYNKDNSIDYSYHFLNNKLQKIAIFYLGLNNHYESIISQITSEYDIKNWDIDSDEDGEFRNATNKAKNSDYGVWNCVPESFIDISISMIGCDFGTPVSSGGSSMDNASSLHGTLNGHDWVNMGGKNVYWATTNIGASTEREFGYRFAWGEIEPKNEFTKENYKFYKDGNYTKYNDQDGLASLLPEDDAATQLWGEGWRMPTAREVMELYGGCYWDMGHAQSRTTRAKIFIPYDIYATVVWTSTAKFCGTLMQSSRGLFQAKVDRYIRCSIRPVCDKAYADSVAAAGK